MSSEPKGHKGVKEYKNAIQNRDLSWIQFNERVLEEGENRSNPLLEQANFAAIVTSNMDEFFQVRYHSICEKRASDKGGRLYDEVNMKLRSQCDRQYRLYDRLAEDMFREGIAIFPSFIKTDAMAKREEMIFQQEILPNLKIELFGSCPIRQKQLYLCVKLLRKKNQPFRLIPLPTSISRVYNLSDDDTHCCLIPLEDIIRGHLHRLFPKDMVEYSALFRVLRDQDIPLTDDSQQGIAEATRVMLSERENGKILRVETEKSISAELLAMLIRTYSTDLERIYLASGPLDLNKLLKGINKLVNRPDLKYDDAPAVLLTELMSEDLFEQIEKQDKLMFHPYYRFDPVVYALQRAAQDPSVTRICQTLYRVSENSLIAQALIQAAENGKEVFVMVELRARFDEANNLYWGEKLEKAGCSVLYGIPGYKVHSKITLIERMVNGEKKHILHLGTGNYNEGTAKAYTDFGLLTADQVLCKDADAFFEGLMNHKVLPCEELAVAPESLYPRLAALIQRERKNAKDGKSAHILAKMNSLNDNAIILDLIEAAKDGVKVQLLVRGLCTLIPNVDGISEKIKVRSIVGRNLEHARAFIFENDGDHEVYLSSADWMERNLYKRVELMFPVKDEACKKAVENVLRLQWNDTEKCRHRRKNGEYVLHSRGTGGIDAQDMLVHDAEGIFSGSHPVFSSIPSLFQSRSDFLKAHAESELSYKI